MDDKATALGKLAKLSADPTFAQEFIMREGLDVVIQNVENGILYAFSCYWQFTLTSFTHVSF